LPESVAERRQGLKALFELHSDDIYRFTLARSGDRGAADEVTAETFLAASQMFADDRVGEVTRQWLFVVARRRLIDRWRKEERDRNRVARLIRVRGSTGSLDPSAQGSAVDGERVLAALASLPVRQRSAVTLRYLDEFSVSEIAEALETSYRAAEALLARGRASFKIAWESG
jgi:RNA polymerase sigma-70 factor (ECF subfamily)